MVTVYQEPEAMTMSKIVMSDLYELENKIIMLDFPWDKSILIRTLKDMKEFSKILRREISILEEEHHGIKVDVSYSYTLIYSLAEYDILDRNETMKRLDIFLGAFRKEITDEDKRYLILRTIDSFLSSTISNFKRVMYGYLNEIDIDGSEYGIGYMTMTRCITYNKNKLGYKKLISLINLLSVTI